MAPQIVQDITAARIAVLRTEYRALQIEVVDAYATNTSEAHRADKLAQLNECTFALMALGVLP